MITYKITARKHVEVACLEFIVEQPSQAVEKFRDYKLKLKEIGVQYDQIEIAPERETL